MWITQSIAPCRHQTCNTQRSRRRLIVKHYGIREGIFLHLLHLYQLREECLYSYFIFQEKSLIRISYLSRQFTSIIFFIEDYQTNFRECISVLNNLFYLYRYLHDTVLRHRFFLILYYKYKRIQRCLADSIIDYHRHASPCNLHFHEAACKTPISFASIVFDHKELNLYRWSTDNLHCFIFLII